MTNFEDLRLQKIVTAIALAIREDILVIQGSLSEPAKMWQDGEQVRESRDGALKAQTSARTLHCCIREISMENSRMHDVTRALTSLEVTLKEIFNSFDELLYANKTVDKIRRQKGVRIRVDSQPPRHAPDQKTLQESSRRVNECLGHLDELVEAATELGPAESNQQLTLDEIAKHNADASPEEVWVTREDLKALWGCSKDTVIRELNGVPNTRIGPKGTVVYVWKVIQRHCSRKSKPRYSLPSNPRETLRQIAKGGRQGLGSDNALN
ncbi:MAG TPA: hypothetical protein VFG04_08545 [Planctomycetaceae bacterium]|jgi:hypothetical protein|nr:hypothetical protein [Planctomycetaceae bacterium]